MRLQSRRCRRCRLSGQQHQWAWWVAAVTSWIARWGAAVLLEEWPRFCVAAMASDFLAGRLMPILFSKTPWRWTRTSLRVRYAALQVVVAMVQTASKPDVLQRLHARGFGVSADRGCPQIFLVPAGLATPLCGPTRRNKGPLLPLHHVTDWCGCADNHSGRGAPRSRPQFC